MLAVDDIFYTASSVVKSFFAEDVGLWLDKNKVRYITAVKLTGKSGYDRAFEFVIPRSSLYPDRILQSINSPRKSAVELFIFKWLDTVEARHQESKTYAVLNDEEVPLGVMDAFRNHNIFRFSGAEDGRSKKNLPHEMAWNIQWPLPWSPGLWV